MYLNIPLETIDRSEQLKRKQYVNYETFNIEKYKKMFQQLLNEEKIIGSFGSTQWKLPCNISDYPVIVKFDIEIYYDFNLVLKAYTIVRLLSGRSAITVYNEVVLIKKAILESNGFKNLQLLESYFEKQGKLYSYQGHRLSFALKSFVSFYNIDDSNKIIDICNNVGMYKKQSRDLPNFNDVMIFDDVVNDYFQSYSTKQTLEYFPIMLWWLLTNIIPMRPSEFLLIKKNCLKVNENKFSPYSIKVPRIKYSGNQLKQLGVQEYVDIDEKTFNFISKVVQQLNIIDSSSEYLFPVELLWKYRKHKRSKKNNRINRRDFDFLKKQFYEKVVEDIYGMYNLERIKSGDTRHFAIINMALQGFNMLSIARMAGHEEIRSQFSYYSHAEHFAESYIYRMAQKRLETDVTNKIGNGIIGWKRYIYDKGKNVDFKEIDLNEVIGRIDFGYCLEKKSVFPSTCIESCKFCPKFAFRPAVNEQEKAITWLTDSSELLNRKIRESIKLMRDLSMDLSRVYRQGNDELLKSTSQSLMTYMNMKSIVDSNLMEADAFDKKHKKE